MTAHICILSLGWKQRAKRLSEVWGRLCNKYHTKVTGSRSGLDVTSHLIMSEEWYKCFTDCTTFNKQRVVFHHLTTY